LKAGTFSEDYIMILMKELAKGLEYLHSLTIMHRDIKCELLKLREYQSSNPGANILMTAEGGVKLADFGVSGKLKESMTRGRPKVSS
jgi:serine/threonine protein kinase